jgi:hypothetical protein
LCTAYALVRAELDKQATELESTLAESGARVKTAMGELEETLVETARFAVANGKLNKSAAEKAQRSIAAADRAVTGAVRMCKPVALRAAADTLGRRGKRASSAGDSAAVSTALYAARVMVRRAAESAMTSFAGAHQSIPAGTANGLLEIRRELSAVVGWWIALMADINSGVAAAAAVAPKETDAALDASRPGESVPLLPVTAGLVVRINAAAGSLRAAAFAARDDMTAILGAVGGGRLINPSAEILGLENFVIAHVRNGFRARATLALTGIEEGIAEAAGVGKESGDGDEDGQTPLDETPLDDESRESVWAVIEGSAEEVWRDVVAVAGGAEDVLNKDLGGVLGGMGSVLADDEVGLCKS